jgi:hypothetical protein
VKIGNAVMRKAGILTLYILAFAVPPSKSGQIQTWQTSPVITDNYDVTFGPAMEGIPGDPEFFVPIKISVSRPTTRVNLLLIYEPVLLTPTLLAPNIFVQSFKYDLSTTGKIKMELTTDLPPPPVIPPLLGDTTIAWISFRIMSCDIGYDYLSHITYYEDPVTPLPDNYIVLDNDDIIASPPLTLHPADILIWHPNYGDINLNTYPWEIADAVLFMNYFSGIAQFNRRQYANSDCNRDCVQASIADLVFLLRRLTGDTTLLAHNLTAPYPNSTWKLSGTSADDNLLSRTRYDIVVKSDEPFGGASFVLDFDDLSQLPEAIELDSSASYMQLLCSLNGNKMRVTVVNMDKDKTSYKGGRLLSIIYNDNSAIKQPFKIESDDFSNNDGFKISPHYEITSPMSQSNIIQTAPGFSLSGYPNPFNGAVVISLSLPSDGHYKLLVYDILGREVRTLLDNQMTAGSHSIKWDGADQSGIALSSGTYFLRLQGERDSQSTKLFLLK